MIEKIDPDDENSRHFLTPEMVDHMLRSAIQHAWMVLPKEKRTIDETEKQIRRMVDRAFQNMREDFDNFLTKET